MTCSLQNNNDNNSNDRIVEDKACIDGAELRDVLIDWCGVTWMQWQYRSTASKFIIWTAIKYFLYTWNNTQTNELEMTI